MEHSKPAEGEGVLVEDHDNVAKASTGNKESKSKENLNKDAERKETGDESDHVPKETTKDPLAAPEGSPSQKETIAVTPTDNNLANQTIPLLYYTRVRNAVLPRVASEGDETADTPFQSQCTCSIMGRILLSAENLSGHTTATGTEDETPPLTLLQQHFPHLSAAGPEQPVELFVSVMGFADGSVAVLDAKTRTVVSSKQFKIRESGKHHAVVGLSMDSSGSFLAAVDAGGMCSIFEMSKFQIQLAVRPNETGATSEAGAPSPTAGHSNVFSNFMSAFGGSSQSHAASTDEANDRIAQPTLVVGTLQTHRISYPRNFGAPTTVAIDPSFKRRREKAVLVGFADGRLVRTSRGLIFQRRNDSVIHQALTPSSSDSSMAPGIQSLVWRGPLVAWAEPSGIRLFDADNLSKIAHVDRPVGARPSLYPSVKNMTARLCFETADHLLVAWGDCLLQLTIRDSSASAAPAPTASEGSSEGAPRIVRRRTVECTMAWELDCIAVGVAPLDANHVIVLGLVPTAGDENNGGKADESQNEVELQVVARMNGNVVYSDLLPMVTGSPEVKQKRSKKSIAESIASFSLLSTYNTPHMENAIESLIVDSPGTEFDPTSLFSGDFSARNRFRDPHLRWDVSHVSSVSVPGNEETADTSGEEDDGSDEDESSAGSVDSDDYSFIYRPLEMESSDSVGSNPPMVWVVSGSDAIAARVRSLDDVIHAVRNKPALALQRALRRRADLRTHKLDDLVNAYFVAVLRRRESGKKRLSLRRMKLAATAMPVLIGGNMELWRHWIAQLEELPGALFILKNVIPVRDPVLPPESYTIILQKMFQQILQMKETSQTALVAERLVGEAANHFLFTVLGWGTSLGIREHLNLFNYLFDMSPSYRAPLVTMEEMAKRRKQQSSSIYLSFPTENHDAAHDPSGVHYQAPSGADELNDSLYDLDEFAAYLEKSLWNDQVHTSDHGGRVALDAMAKLMIGKGKYDDALKYLLLLGTRYGSLSLDEVESSAVRAVEDGRDGPTSKAGFPYAFVLSLIETKHLHQLLLEKSLLVGKSSVLPIIALMQLVGVDLAGDFLVKHCVPVQSSGRRLKGQSTKDSSSGDRRGTLPLDVVAHQLESSPKILYWYLHCVMMGKPEVYVKFPNTANPPEAVTTLHRKSLDLYMKYAGSKKDSANVLRGVEAYRVAETSTPLLTFLRSVLQLGGLNPKEVAKQLQIQRKGGPGVSGIFALELAFIMDRYGEQNQENANVILELYLHGAKSLVLAVSYAQRSKGYRKELLQVLIDYCLSTDQKAEGGNRSNLFGSLLEAAALCGADLAHLVTKIPPGMSIEGLRPRLVAAVSDYRFKRQLHAQANEIAAEESLQIFREYEHRARRGRRYELSDKIEVPNWAATNGIGRTSQMQAADRFVPLASLKPRARPHRFNLSYTLPMM